MDIEEMRLHLEEQGIVCLRGKQELFEYLYESEALEEFSVEELTECIPSRRIIGAADREAVKELAYDFNIDILDTEELSLGEIISGVRL